MFQVVSTSVVEVTLVIRNWLAMVYLNVGEKRILLYRLVAAVYIDSFADRAFALYCGLYWIGEEGRVFD